MHLQLRSLRSTNSAAAAPAGQFDVFTDEHLLFTTPQVIAHASSQLQVKQAHKSVREFDV